MALELTKDGGLPRSLGEDRRGETEAMEAETQSRTGHGNRLRVLREMVLNEPLSRTEIAGRLDLSDAAVSRITRGLIDEGLVREVPEEPDPHAGPGRRTKRLDIVAGSGYVLGIGIGLTLQTITLADLKNRVVASIELELSDFDDPERVIDLMARESLRLMDTHVPNRDRMLGGCIMISGAVDTATGNVRYSDYLRGWNDVPLRSKLVESLGIPMRVESLSNAVALAEARFGAAQGRNDVLCTTCALGLGTGLILDGRLIRGHNFNAGIIGHIKVTTETGQVTTLDRVASGRGVLQRLYGYDVDLSRGSLARMGKDLLDAIERDRNGDPAVTGIMSEMGYRLGFITAQGIRFVAPEIFVIAGPLSMSPSYVAAARASIAEAVETFQVEVATSNVTGPVTGQSASCGLAICEYLFEEEQTPPKTEQKKK